MFRFVLKRGHETDVPTSLLTRLDLFKRKPELVGAGRYAIKSDVDSDVFGLFMTRLYGGTSNVSVTTENVEQLQALCDELGFAGFDSELRAVLGRGVDLKVRKELIGVRTRIDRHDVLLEQLQRRVLELESQLQEVRALPQRVEAVEQRLEATAQAVAEVQRRDVSDDVESLKREIRARASAADVRALSDEVSRLKGAEARHATTPQAPRAEAVVPAGRVFSYHASRPLDGIIAHLTCACGGTRSVGVTASSFCRGGDDLGPENVIDLGSNSRFWSEDSPNSWICYDFGWRCVTPTSYSIKSYGGGPGWYNPKSWVLEGSNYGGEGSWEVVDSRKDNFDLDHSYVTRNFEISAPPRRAFRFVRLRLTGKNHFGNDALVICAFEIFGTLSTN